MRRAWWAASVLVLSLGCDSKGGASAKPPTASHGVVHGVRAIDDQRALLLVAPLGQDTAQVVLVDADAGPVWTATLPANRQITGAAAIAIAGDVVAVAHQDRYGGPVGVSGLARADGKEAWTVELAPRWTKTTRDAVVLLAAGDRVIHLDELDQRTTITAIDAARGAVVWQRVLSDWGRLVAETPTHLVLGVDDELVAIRRSDGVASRTVPRGRACVVSGRVMLARQPAVGHGDELIALDLDDPTRDEVWMPLSSLPAPPNASTGGAAMVSCAVHAGRLHLVVTWPGLPDAPALPKARLLSMDPGSSIGVVDLPGFADAAWLGVLGEVPAVVPIALFKPDVYALVDLEGGRALGVVPRGSNDVLSPVGPGAGYLFEHGDAVGYIDGQGQLRGALRDGLPSRAHQIAGHTLWVASRDSTPLDQLAWAAIDLGSFATRASGAGFEPERDTKLADVWKVGG